MNTNAFRKVVRLGTQESHGGRWYSVFCKIEYTGGRLSITGVEGPTQGGNAVGGCGQIYDGIRPGYMRFAPGWTLARLVEFLRIWRRWHLNDMRPGSPAQREWLRQHPEVGTDYTERCEALAAAGLNPDPSFPYGAEGKPYAYGSAWLTEEVPAEVLDFLRALPDTDRQPAWV